MESLGVAIRLVLAVWPLWLALGAAYVIRWAFGRWELNRLARSGIEEVDEMGGKTFEKYLEAIFRRKGYRVTHTPYSGDYGAYLLIWRDGITTIVQAKRSKRNVGPKAVGDILRARTKYQCIEAIIVTNAPSFTEQARQEARDNQIALWDRERLIEELLSLRDGSPKSSRDEWAHPVRAHVGLMRGPDPQEIPACDVCGKPLSDRVVEFCRANSGRFNDRLYCFDHQGAPTRDLS